MKCKLNDKCEFGDLCKSATRHDSLTVLGCSSYKAKEPMTNEEWLRSLNTEQLAEWLAQRDCDDLPIDATEVKEILKKEWLEWLKEKHE